MNVFRLSYLHYTYLTLFSSVQFSTLTEWVVGGTWRTIQQRPSTSLFCGRPLWAVVAWAGMSSLWRCASSNFSADHGVTHSEGWIWRGCRGAWHARIMPVSVSWQLVEEVPVDPQWSWCCSAPSRWSRAPSRRCGEVSSGTLSRQPGSFSQSQQSPCLTAVEEDSDRTNI